MEMPQFKTSYNQPGIDLLPHRHPFLFVDTLLSADETGAVGEYTFTAEKNEFFKGHFPDFPVVPGVILLEAMSQIAGASVVARGVIGNQIAFAVAAFDGAKFREPFRPGDRLVTVVRIVRERVPLGVYEVKGYRNGEADKNGNPAVECTVKCMMGKALVAKKNAQGTVGSQV